MTLYVPLGKHDLHILVNQKNTTPTFQTLQDRKIRAARIYMQIANLPLIIYIVKTVGIK